MSQPTTSPQPAASRASTRKRTHRGQRLTRDHAAMRTSAHASQTPVAAHALPAPSWDEELFAHVTEADLASPTILSSNLRREIWNRLCWALRHVTTREEYAAHVHTIGVWVSSLTGMDPGIINEFTAQHQQLITSIKALPSGRDIPDISQRRMERDPDGRIHIYLSTDEAIVGDATVRALGRYLAQHQCLFRYGSRLVLVADGRLHQVEEPQMRNLLTRACRFLALTGGGERKRWTNAHPPVWLVKDLMSRHDWLGIPTIRGVVSYPIFLADGRILCQPGYDAASQMYVLPGCIAIAIPDTLTQEDARQASARIFSEMFTDFPRMQNESAAVMLAALLTIVARHAIDGPCPGFLLDGNAPGVGKGKLCQTISIISTGRETTAIAPETRHEEWRKRIVSILRDAEPLVLIDNIAGRFGAPALDAVLTATEWGDRELGTSTNWRGPANTVWFFTANNIQLQGDLVRRILPIRLVTTEERPDTRSQFRHHDLLAAARRLRTHLLHDCFVMLRAWHQAGMPNLHLPAYGSYESWSQVVRGCVFWCGWGDARVAADYLREQPDENDSLFKVILDNWFHLQTFLTRLPPHEQAVTPGGVVGDMPVEHAAFSLSNEAVVTCAGRHRSGCPGLTLQELLALPEFIPGRRAIVEALQGLFPNGMLPTPQRIGTRIHQWKDRVFHGLCLSTRVVHGTTYWYVCQRLATPMGSGVGVVGVPGTGIA